MPEPKHYTCNVRGDKVRKAKERGYHAYYANGVTAIEITAHSKSTVRRIISKWAEVLYIFE